ncbi:MAG: hypothetical protein AB7I29_07670 [Geobacter sp.]
MTATVGGPTPTIILTMNEQAVDTILAGLAKLPLEVAYNLFEGIRMEKEAQLQQFYAIPPSEDGVETPEDEANEPQQEAE